MGSREERAVAALDRWSLQTTALLRWDVVSYEDVPALSITTGPASVSLLARNGEWICAFSVLDRDVNGQSIARLRDRPADVIRLATDYLLTTTSRFSTVSDLEASRALAPVVHDLAIAYGDHHRAGAALEVLGTDAAQTGEYQTAAGLLEEAHVLYRLGGQSSHDDLAQFGAQIAVVRQLTAQAETVKSWPMEQLVPDLLSGGEVLRESSELEGVGDREVVGRDYVLSETLKVRIARVDGEWVVLTMLASRKLDSASLEDTGSIVAHAYAQPLRLLVDMLSGHDDRWPNTVAAATDVFPSLPPAQALAALAELPAGIIRDLRATADVVTRFGIDGDFVSGSLAEALADFASLFPTAPEAAVAAQLRD